MTLWSNPKEAPTNKRSNEGFEGLYLSAGYRKYADYFILSDLIKTSQNVKSVLTPAGGSLCYFIVKIYNSRQYSSFIDTNCLR